MRLVVVEMVAVAQAVDDLDGLAVELGVTLPLPLALTVPLTLRVAQSVGEALGLEEEVEQGHMVGLVLTDRVRVTLGLLEAVVHPEGVRVLEKDSVPVLLTLPHTVPVCDSEAVLQLE